METVDENNFVDLNYGIFSTSLFIKSLLAKKVFCNVDVDLLFIFLLSTPTALFVKTWREFILLSSLLAYCRIHLPPEH